MSDIVKETLRQLALLKDWLEHDQFYDNFEKIRFIDWLSVAATLLDSLSKEAKSARDKQAALKAAVIVLQEEVYAWKNRADAAVRDIVKTVESYEHESKH